jgi:hypothetical protein
MDRLHRRSFLKSAAIFTAAAAASASWLSGCRTEDARNVDQSRIHTAFWLFYNVNNDVTFARATFRFGGPLGTLLDLRGASEVRFNDRPMPLNSSLGWHELQIAGESLEGTFSYKDANGRRRDNSARIERIAFDAAPAEIVRANSFTLAWSGAEIRANEDLEVIVSDRTGLDFERFDQTAVGSRSIVLPADKLQRVDAGAGILSMRRHHAVPPSQATDAGGEVRATFQPRDQLITLR